MNQTPSEHAEQCALFEWWNYQAPKEIRNLLFAIPNGGARDKVTGARLKAEGVRRGIPDMFLAMPKNGKAGLWIELKRSQGGIVSSEQAAMVSALLMQGYEAVICKGWLQAKDFIQRYLNWK